MHIQASWGGFELVDIAKELFRAALVDPANKKMVLLSESCLPLYPATVPYAQLIAEPKSRINACPDQVSNVSTCLAAGACACGCIDTGAHYLKGSLLLASMYCRHNEARCASRAACHALESKQRCSPADLVQRSKLRPLRSSASYMAVRRGQCHDGGTWDWRRLSKLCNPTAQEL